jgi:probable O-glycosylation ligase (exosortase A-associated)
MKIYIGIFPSLWLINSRDRLRWLLITIALSFGLIGLKGGVFALASGFQYRVWGPPYSFYTGNNEIGMVLTMTLPLLFLCAKEAKAKWAKALFYSSFVLSVFSVIGTWSRGGLLTLSAVLGAMILTGNKKWLSVPIILVAVALLLPRLPEKWFDRMQTIKTYQEDGSALGRLDAWQFAIDRALRDPLTGGGFESFSGKTDSHSAYFEILGHHGFVALGLWLALLFGTMIALGRLRRQASNLIGAAWIEQYARAIQISLLGYAVGAVFLGTAYWDILYHLVAICAILKVQLAQAQAVQEASTGVGGLTPAPSQLHPLTQS